MIKVKDGYAKLINTSYTGDISLVLLSNGGTIGYDISTNTILATIGSNVASADKLKNKVKLWGLDFDGTTDVNGSIVMNNSTFISMKDTGGADRVILNFDGLHRFFVGNGTSSAGYDSYIDGNNIYLRYGTSHTTGIVITSTGRISAKVNMDLANSKSIYFKDTNGDDVDGIFLSNANNFHIGYGASRHGYNTYLDGKNIELRYGLTPSTGFVLNSSGNITIGSSDLASTSSKLYVDGYTQIKSASTPLRLVTTNTNSYSSFLDAYHSSLTSGQYYLMNFGLTASKNNSAWMGFYYSGSASTSNRISFGFTGNDNLFNIAASGNVGIGTTSPTTKLHVSGTALASKFMMSGTTGAITGIARSWTDTYNDAASNARPWCGLSVVPGQKTYEEMTLANYYGMLFKTGGSSFPYIFMGGDVGIGTNSPLAKLHVEGNILATGGFIKSGSDDTYVLLGGGGHKLVSDFASASSLGNYVTLGTEQTITGTKIFKTTVNVKGYDLRLTPIDSSSNDSGDIVFYYGNGQEKSRIWTNNVYTSALGPNYRVFREDGTELYNSRLALLSEIPTKTSQLTNDSGYVTGGPYLPLSGGTIGAGNSNTFPLNISSTNDYTGIAFSNKNSTAYFRYLGAARWNVTNDGWTESYDLWHSGNDGSGSGLDADLLDGKQPSELNVGSATKLQTARTIWGQLFDGTGNVSGDLYIGSKVIRGNANLDIINSTGNWVILGHGIAESGNITYVDGYAVRLRYSTSHTTGLLLNSSGNITIGSSDLASSTTKLYVNGQVKIAHDILFDVNNAGLGFKDTDGTNRYNLIMGTDNVLRLGAGQASAGYLTYILGKQVQLRYGTSHTLGFILNESGNVGIGTTSPSAKLHVAGNILATEGFFKLDSSNDYVLLGGGGHKSIASFQTTYDNRYVLKAGDTMTGVLSMKNDVNPRISFIPSSGSSTLGTIYLMGGSSTAYSGIKFKFRQWSYTANSLTRLSYYEDYNLPETAAGLTANASYTILTTKNASVSGGGSTWGSSITVNINGVSKTLTIPSNPNTHWTTRLYAGASGTAANSAVDDPYLKVTDDNVYRNQIRFVGSGNTTVKSDAEGNIIISSTGGAGGGGYWANVPVSSTPDINTSPIFLHPHVIGQLTIQLGEGSDYRASITMENNYLRIQPRLDKVGYNYNTIINPEGGNVGIGTTAPSYKLHVDGHIGSTDTVFGKAITAIGNTVGPYLPNINWYDQTGNTGFHVSYRLNETAKPLRFYYRTGDTYTLLVDITSTGTTINGTLTINGGNAYPLIINSSYATENGLVIRMSGTNKTWVGYTTGTGSYLYNYTGPHKIGVNDSGIGFIDSNTILHTGNYTSHTVESRAWTAVTTKNAWSRIMNMSSNSNVILTIQFSQNGLASAHGYFISTGWNCAKIMLVMMGGYTGNSTPQVRITSTNSTTFHVEVYNTYGYNGATSISFGCRAILACGSMSTINTYTAGGGTVRSSLTSNSNVAMNFKAEFASYADNSDKLDGFHWSDFVRNIEGTDFNPGDKVGNYFGMSTQSGLNTNWYHIISMNWTNNITSIATDGSNATWQTLLALPTLGRRTIHYRTFNESSPQAWVALLDSNNYTSYTDGRYVNVTGDTMSGTLIFSGISTGNWTEGIRINDSTNGWTSLTMGGTATSGTGAKIWSLHTYDGNFYISKNGSSAGDLTLQNVGNHWYINTTTGGDTLNVGGWIATVGNTGWYSTTHKGGWYMIDGSYVRTYNNVRVHTGSLLRDAFNSAGGYYSSWNNSVGNDWTSILNPANAVFSKDNLYVNHGTALPMMTWANTVNGYGYVTRYSIGSVRPTNDAWGRLRLCVGNNDGGTSCGCYMDLDGDGAISTNASIYAAHFYENSDVRLKTNIENINNSDNIPLLKSFDWKDSNIHSYGLIAQELEEQGYSELVSEGDEGKKTVNYSAALSLIVGKLLVKIKELEKEIEELKNK